MKTISKIFMILILGLSVLSCTMTKESYLQKFSSFVENVKEDGADYDKNKWEKTAREFEKLSTVDYQKFKNDMSPEEKLKVAKLIGQYRAAQVKWGLKYLENNINEAVDKANGFIEGLKENNK